MWATGDGGRGTGDGGRGTGREPKRERERERERERGDGDWGWGPGQGRGTGINTEGVRNFASSVPFAFLDLGLQVMVTRSCELSFTMNDFLLDNVFYGCLVSLFWL